MKTVKQMLRQPMKTLFGVLVIALAVAVLCVCAGQSFAAKETKARLDETFMTIALPTVEYTEAVDSWVLNYAAEHPEVVKSVGSPGLIGGYIPQLSPDNYTAHLDLTDGLNRNQFFLPDISGREYTSAMIEITLTSLGTPSTRWLYPNNGTYEYIDAEAAGAYVNFEGVIENIIGLADGYQDHTGFTVSGVVYMPSMEELKALDMTIGERYLLYGTDYRDNDWWIRSLKTQELKELGGKLFDAFEPERLIVLEDDEIIENAFGNSSQDVVAKYRFDGLIHGIMRWEYDYIRKISFTQNDQSAMPKVRWELDSEGKTAAVPEKYITYSGKDGEVITVEPEEYHERYAEPTIVHLEGTVEDFLDSEEAGLWRDALYNIEINSHAFPMIGVDDLDYIADFAQGKADIVEGRKFTDEELECGARVCILSQSLAVMNNLDVGDTLSVQVYENDPGVPYQINISEGEGSVNPVAYYYFDNTMELEQTEEFTIIGLYKQDIEWGNVDENLYAFTPNTIFIPKKAAAEKMDFGYMGFFRTFVLHNGTVEEFRQAVLDAGFGSMFYYNDNGYSSVEGSMDTYREGASRAVWIGICVYGAILILFLILFSAGQRSMILTMKSLGESRTGQVGHVVTYNMGILVPGTLIGMGMGVFLWQYVVDMLTKGSDIMLEIEMQISDMAVVAAGQLAAALIPSVCIALFMTRQKSLMKIKQ